MSEKTVLLISPRHRVDDILDVIRSAVKCEKGPKVDHVDPQSPSDFTICFTPKRTREEHAKASDKVRSMSVHLLDPTPLGPATSLSLGANEEGRRILAAIAERVGGFLCRSDTRCDYEMVDGIANPDDRISYYFRRALARGVITGDDDVADAEALLDYVRKEARRP